MTDRILPAGILILGSFILPFIHGKKKNIFIILLPAITFYIIWKLEPGTYLQVKFFGSHLTLLRVDKLSKVFGYIFSLNAFVAFIYSYWLDDDFQHISALLYIGSSLGVVFAGDLLTLYFFWEGMAVFSTFLILARRTEKSKSAGMRYIMVHIFGGLCLLAGIVMYIQQTGSMEFNYFSEANTATWLILLGFLVNAAAPPISAWLPDAYPESTVTGGIILSAYTTKTAVYTLVRGFPGWNILIIVGCIMTIYGIIYALLENDMRRILAYSIINQVGFMVCGVGIGTQLAINGTVSHAFCHIIYKALLWMSAGAVLYMTGRSKCTDLGGLYKTMPLTLLFGGIGALSISAFPATSGFTSKSMIIEGAVHEHMVWAWLVLQVASAGVFLHAGIKFPYFVFFAKDSGLRPGETNKSMLIAMGIMSFICIFLGVYPKPLYNVLPYEVHYNAYHLWHVITQLQLLMFSALVFFLFLPLLKRTETISIDTDWFYRKGGVIFYRLMDKGLNTLIDLCEEVFAKRLVGYIRDITISAPEKTTTTLMMAVWKAKGLPGEKVNQRKEFLNNGIRRGALPIGISAVMAVIFLVVISLFL